MNESEEKAVGRIAEWVLLTYGNKALNDLVMNFPKYVDAYNEAMAESMEKLQKSEETCNALAAQVYAEIKE